MAAVRASPEELLKNTNFTRQEVEALQFRFAGLLPPQPNSSFGGADRDPLVALYTGKIDRARFRDLLADGFGVDDSLLMDRVFRTFDTDADNYISYEEFIKGMSVFLKGRLEERTRYCFRVYDLNGDRYISKEEMYQMLRNCLVRGQEEDEDGVKDLVDLVLKKLDEDRDGRVSEADWIAAIGKEQLLMEAFGQCLPRNKTIEHYLSFSSDNERLGPGKPSRYITSASRASAKYPLNGRSGGAPLANSTSSIASDLATEAAEALQTPHHHTRHISKHVHPHAQHPKRIVVAPAAGLGPAAKSNTVPRGGGGHAPGAPAGDAPAQGSQGRKVKA
ncbi:EF-hand calcium-binding domain-containing protein 1 [Thoreauomyces humboldtii]|nr:EF-hand calcium-binding domain-containing protein 1 [Thoreauomyces humboldtii]